MCNCAVYEFAERRQRCQQQRFFVCEDDPCLTSLRIQTVCMRRLEFVY